MCRAVGRVLGKEKQEIRSGCCILQTSLPMLSV